VPIALPLGNGSTRGCGSMAHVHEAGIPARAGVFAAQVAAAGFTACTDYLDGNYSWGVQFAGETGARPYDEAKLTAGLGERLFLELAGVAPKQYGSCGVTHQTIHGTIEIMRDNGIGPNDIESIELRVPPWADRIAPYREPVSGEQAKFSDHLIVRLRDGQVITNVVPSLEAHRHTLDERIAMFKNTAKSLAERADRLVDVVMDLEHHTVSDVAALAR
jgi:2-methylcitrate dehydratase PrpD